MDDVNLRDLNDLGTLVDRNFSVSRVHGGNLGRVMGKLLFPNLSVCIAELVSNAYDADASRVQITYDDKADLLVIEDDGEGMDVKGVQNFYRIGDSAKLSNPVSKKGRKRIGQYGVATLVLRKLAHRYQLETSCDGQMLSLEETFTDKDRDETAIAVQSSSTDAMRHGTVIKMRELRFSPATEGFSIDRLRRTLAVEMPLSEDFSISVNGDLIRSRAIPANALEYMVDVREDHLIGDVSGAIYASARALPEGENGIFIKVRGRAVGGSNLALFGLTAGVASRVYGVIHADSLVDIVGFDRSKFVDDPKFDRLRGYIADVLKQVRQDLEVDVVVVKKTKAREMLESTVENVEKKLSKQLGGGPYTILFDDDKAGAVAAFDYQKKAFYINSESSALVIPSFKETDVKRALFDAVKHALAREMISSEDDRRAFDELARSIPSLLGNSGRAISLSELVDLSEDEVEVRRMSPDRLYSFAEVSKATGYRNMVLKRMIEAKLFPDRGDKLRWKDVAAVVEKLHDRTPLVDLIQEIYPSPDAFDVRQAKEKRVLRRLDELSGSVSFPPYVVNIAERGETFYAVENSGKDAMRSFIESDRAADIPRAVGLLTNKQYGVVGIGKGKGALVYSLERSGDMDFLRVLTAANNMLAFVDGVRAQDIGRLVKRASYYFPYRDTHYVIGICSLMDVKDIDILGIHFRRNGFEEGRVDKDLVRPMYDSLNEQRTRVFPLVETTRNLDVYGPIVDGLK